MAHYILVPGAWLGGWAWARIVPLLEAQGHSANGLTLSGLADRAGERPMGEIDLDAHAADIVAAVDASPGGNIIVVSHSYSGLPVLQAVDALGDRVAHVAHVDSGVAESGTAMFDGEWAAARRERLSQTGIWDPEPEQFEGQGLSEADIALLTERATPHPGRTLTQPLHLTRPLSAVPTTYLHCLLDTPEFDEDTAVLAENHGWRVEHLDAGHWPMLSTPELLAQHLLAAAR